MCREHYLWQNGKEKLPSFNQKCVDINYFVEGLFGLISPSTLYKFKSFSHDILYFNVHTTIFYFLEGNTDYDSTCTSG